VKKLRFKSRSLDHRIPAIHKEGTGPPVRCIRKRILKSAEDSTIVFWFALKLVMKLQGTHRNLFLPLQRPEDRPPFSSLLGQLAEIAESGL
jgi:hypothetical protein